MYSSNTSQFLAGEISDQVSSLLRMSKIPNPLSPFLALPAEIRSQIYSLLFDPWLREAEQKARKSANGFICGQHYHNTESEMWDQSCHVIPRTTSSPEVTASTVSCLRLRSVCRMICQDVSPIFYGNATFYVRQPLDFANNFLLNVELDSVLQLRHLEIRMEGPPVDGWYLSTSNFSYWSNTRDLFKNYPELSCLSTLTIAIEKPAQRSRARCAPLHDHIARHAINYAWDQDKDTRDFCFHMTTLKERILKDFGITQYVFDDLEVDESYKRHLRSLDGKFECAVDMKRTFLITMWKQS